MVVVVVVVVVRGASVVVAGEAASPTGSFPGRLAQPAEISTANTTIIGHRSIPGG